MREELITFILAMLPVSELRGAIPFGLSNGIPLERVLLLSLAGNLLPVIPLYFLLDRILAAMGRHRYGKRFSDWIIAHGRKRSRLIEIYETIGLAIFVGIPLPITGAWTGTLASVLLKLKFKNYIIGILAGISMAASIVTVLWLFFGFAIEGILKR